MSTFEKLAAQIQNIAHRTYPILKKGWEWTCTAAGKCAVWSKKAYLKAKPHVITGLEKARHWFLGLQPRTRMVVAATSGVVVLGLLGLAVGGMTGKNGQSSNVPQASATALAVDDMQVETSEKDVAETVRNENTVVLAQATPAATTTVRKEIESSPDVPAVIELEGHTDEVWSVAFSPDGKKIVTSSWDRTARIWDAESGKELQKLEGHTDVVRSVAFSPDGKKIVTGSNDRTARIWNLVAVERQHVAATGERAEREPAQHDMDVLNAKIVVYVGLYEFGQAKFQEDLRNFHSMIKSSGKSLSQAEKIIDETISTMKKHPKLEKYWLAHFLKERLTEQVRYERDGIPMRDAAGAIQSPEELAKVHVEIQMRFITSDAGNRLGAALRAKGIIEQRGGNIRGTELEAWLNASQSGAGTYTFAGQRRSILITDEQLEEMVQRAAPHIFR